MAYFLPGAGGVAFDHREHARSGLGVHHLGALRPGRNGLKRIQVTLSRSAGDLDIERADRSAPPTSRPLNLVAGHSLGGAYARRYAQLYPSEVAGVLFLEPFYRGVRQPETVVDPARHPAGRSSPSCGWPPPPAAVLPGATPAAASQCGRTPFVSRSIDYHLRALRPTIKERKNLFHEVDAEVRDGGIILPDVPVIVLAAMGIDRFEAALMPDADLRELNTRKPALDVSPGALGPARRAPPGSTAPGTTRSGPTAQTPSSRRSRTCSGRPANASRETRHQPAAVARPSAGSDRQLRLTCLDRPAARPLDAELSFVILSAAAARPMTRTASPPAAVLLLVSLRLVL